MKRRALNFKTIVLIVVLIAVGLLILWLVTRKRIEGWTPLAGDYSKGVGDMSQAAGVTVAQAQNTCANELTNCNGFVFVPNQPPDRGVAYFKNVINLNEKNTSPFPGTVTYCKPGVQCGASPVVPQPEIPPQTPPVVPQPGGAPSLNRNAQDGVISAHGRNFFALTWRHTAINPNITPTHIYTTVDSEPKCIQECAKPIYTSSNPNSTDPASLTKRVTCSYNPSNKECKVYRDVNTERVLVDTDSSVVLLNAGPDTGPDYRITYGTGVNADGIVHFWSNAEIDPAIIPLQNYNQSIDQCRNEAFGFFSSSNADAFLQSHTREVGGRNAGSGNYFGACKIYDAARDNLTPLTIPSKLKYKENSYVDLRFPTSQGKMKLQEMADNLNSN